MKTPYYIEPSNKTRPFQNIASDMRNASCVVIKRGEMTAQMKVEMDILFKLRDIHIHWRPSDRKLKLLRDKPLVLQSYYLE